MSDNHFLSWIGKMIDQNIHKRQFQTTKGAASFQNEAYTRELLREAKKKRHRLETPIRQIPFIVLDTETTGFNPERGDRIISISAAKSVDGVVVDTFNTFINPEREIPNKITDLTGIGGSHIQGAPLLEDVMNRFLTYVSETIIIGYHISHDLSFLNHFLWKYCHARLPQQYLELKQIVEKIHNKSFEKLDDALTFYNIECSQRHTADGDVKAMVELWQYLLREFEQRQIDTLIDLYAHLNR